MVKLWVLVGLLPALVFAAPAAVPVIDRPVIDQAGLLSASEQESVARALLGLRASTGAQMAVLLVDTTSGEPIEDYSIRVARQWRGGQGGANNGLLFVLAAKDRRMRLDVGYGLEEDLPDDVVRRLLDEQLPLMRQKDFAGAIGHIIEGVSERLPASGSASTQASAGSSAASRVRGQKPFIRHVLQLGGGLFMLCALALRPGRQRAWLGREGRALLTVLLLAVPVLFTVHGAWGNEELLFTLVLTLVMSAGLFFLGRELMVNGDWPWAGGCLMVGTQLALLLGMKMPEQVSFLAVPIVSAVCTLGVILVSKMWLGNLVVVPWMFLFGGSQTVRRWSKPVFAQSYSSSSVGVLGSSSSSDTSGSSSWWDSFSSSLSWDSSSSSSSYDSSSSSSSWDSSSSSSSSDSSSSSSDWGGGGGDFGGGGSSSSW